METLVQINIIKEEESIIINFSWELDETNADSTFEKLYKDIENYKSKKNIFDFEKLTYINSKTIWYLVDIYSTIEEAEWKMYIRNCPEWIKDTLNFTWIDTIIPYI